jgi:hypothetical protein
VDDQPSERRGEVTRGSHRVLGLECSGHGPTALTDKQSDMQLCESDPCDKACEGKQTRNGGERK